MSKAKQEIENTENTETETGAETETEKAKRGTSFIVQARNAFLEILGEFTTSGGVSVSTLEDYRELFETAPEIKGVGLPLDVQLANAVLAVERLYSEAKVIDGLAYFSETQADERKKLIAKRDKLQKAVDAAKAANSPA